MPVVAELAESIGTAPACQALGLARSSFYRQLKPRAKAVTTSRPTPPRALTELERQAVLNQLHSPRFVDQSAREIYATLLDEGSYLRSVSTI